MRASEGNGGWFELESAELHLPGRVYVRVSDVDGIDRVTELYLDGRGAPIQPSALQRFPLGWLEEWISSWAMRSRQGVAGPDLSRLASYFSTTWGDYHGRHCERCDAPLAGSSRARRARERAIDNWVELAWISQHTENFADVHVQQPPMGDDKRSRAEAPTEVELPALSLVMNDGRLTDAFLSDVARAYEAAIARRLPPAKTLAELVGVEKKTVQSWVYKARKRKLMPPAKSQGRIV